LFCCKIVNAKLHQRQNTVNQAKYGKPGFVQTGSANNNAHVKTQVSQHT